MNIKTKLNNIKSRFKAATQAFLEPDFTLNRTVLVKTREPATVLENQLLAGKNVLITGAARNIGKSIAIEMAKQGANVFCTDINPENSQKLEQELKKYSVMSQVFISDLSKNDDIDNLYNSLRVNHTDIDILVNNVGVSSQPSRIKNLDIEKFKQIFDTNVFGSVYLTQKIAARMIENQIHGSIIFITSIHQWTIRNILSYSASKAALGMIIQELAYDLASYNIRVNGIAPGFVFLNHQNLPVHNEFTPLHKCSIDPCYIGRAAVYLASDYFSYCTTGTVLKIDSGLSLYNHIPEMYP
jgi:NAD(P)-dependent dehydrogenase (short-subunit alcohol dehydrogenase family)